jgi:hypothetical protein
MFGNGKIYETKKVKKRHGMAFYVIGLFTFAIEFMLGVNAAFLVDQSISIVTRNMLSGTFLAPLASVITLITSLAVGFCFVFGGMWVFAGFMDSLDDAKAYIEAYGSGRWPVVMVWALMVAVVALDFTTLLFRASYFAEKGAGPLFAFFLILIFMPPVLGPLIHVLENTPRDRKLSKARRHAEDLETDDMTSLVEIMDSDLRSRWLDGDSSAIEEHHARVEAQRQEAYEYEQRKIREREEKRRNKNRPLASASLAQQARLGSQNDQR